MQITVYRPLTTDKQYHYMNINQLIYIDFYLYLDIGTLLDIGTGN